MDEAQGATGTTGHAEHARSVADGRTRDTVVRLLLEQGPTTAGALADTLGLSGAAVRRHLDALVAEGSVTTRDAPHAAGRGRGRPARQHLLTRSGRARAGRGEDAADLAVAALRALARTAGEDAVRAFARQRAEAMVAALADALSSEGYAASARRSEIPGSTGRAAGDQLCQHHCPVAAVAAEFPQLCEAETEVFAEVLGTHVQRLSTIARGDAACTTHVPGGGRQPSHGNTTTTGPVVMGRQVV